MTESEKIFRIRDMKPDDAYMLGMSDGTSEVPNRLAREHGFVPLDVPGPPKLTYGGLYEIVGRIVPDGRPYTVKVETTRVPSASGSRVATTWSISVESARGHSSPYVGEGETAEEALEDLRSEMALPSHELETPPDDCLGVGLVREE